MPSVPTTISVSGDHVQSVAPQSDWIDHPVFIVGHPKSGTTLLASLLDGHPELMVFPEETHFGYFVHEPIQALFGNQELSEKKRQEKIEWVVNLALTKTHLRLFRSNETEHPTFGNFDYRDFDHVHFEERLRERLKEIPLTPRSIFDCIVLAFSDVSSRYTERDPGRMKMWIEKTPRHVIYIEQLKEWYPKAKFIHVFRDPRDTFVSFHRLYPKSNNLEFSHFWLWGERAGIEHERRLGVATYKRLKYEDLLHHPHEIMTEVLKFIGVDSAAVSLQPTKHGVPWQGNSMWKEKHTGIDTSPIGRFRQYERQDEVRTVEAITGAMMRDYGYEPAFSLTPLERLRARLLFRAYGLGWKLHKAKRRSIRQLLMVKHRRPVAVGPLY